jgi:protease I
MNILNSVRVAVLATDGFEETELTSPVQALRESGAQVDVISLKAGEIQGFKHHDKTIRVKVDRVLSEARFEDYQGIVLPGGALNADALRMDRDVQTFVKSFWNAGLPVAAICHAPWILVSTDLVKAKTLTSYPSIQDDIRNADGNWVDKQVCIDESLITSRQPDDLPAFNGEIVKQLTRFASAQNGPGQRPAA